MDNLNKFLVKHNKLGIERDINYSKFVECLTEECDKYLNMTSETVRAMKRIDKHSDEKEYVVKLQNKIDSISKELFNIEVLQTRLEAGKIFDISIMGRKLVFNRLPAFIKMEDVLNPIENKFKLILVQCTSVVKVDFYSVINNLADSVDLDKILLYHLSDDYFVLKINEDENLVNTLSIITEQFKNSKLKDIQYRYFIGSDLVKLIKHYEQGIL